jgi:hypothetical protein
MQRQPNRHSYRLSVLCAGLLLALPAAAQIVRAFVTSLAGEGIAAEPSPRFGRVTADGPVIHIDEKTQEIPEFGASVLESGLICLSQLDPTLQERVLQSLFDPVGGAGFSAMKTVMGATDFMAAGAFTYNDNPGDAGMKLFSIQRDQGPNGLTTFICRALCGRFALQIPMAYPPGCMLYGVKTN